MKKRTIGILALLAAAAGAAVFALTQGTFNADIPAPVTETPTATATAENQPCAYMWAYQGVPDITAELSDAVQAIFPEASAHAQAFGENCVSADGSFTFGAMETDFYVSLPVPDLDDNAALGQIIESVLSVVDGFPHSRLPGPQDGFVEFTFKNGAEQRIVRVPIPRGVELRRQGLHGAELIQALETP